MPERGNKRALFSRRHSESKVWQRYTRPDASLRCNARNALLNQLQQSSAAGPRNHRYFIRRNTQRPSANTALGVLAFLWLVRRQVSQRHPTTLLSAWGAAPRPTMGYFQHRQYLTYRAGEFNR